GIYYVVVSGYATDSVFNSGPFQLDVTIH
ncbi:MAG: hypothetical protein RJA70_4534, partial [Pseudomonadota bacterium]